MPKTKKQKNNVLFLGIIFIVFTAVFFAVMVFLFFVYNNIQKVQTDLFNVNEVVSVQQKNELVSVQAKLQDLITLGESAEIVMPAYHYIDYDRGFELDMPFEIEQQSGIISNEDELSFGSLVDYRGQMLPRYTLKVFLDYDFEDYKSMIRFSNEECLEDEECIIYDSDIEEGEDRNDKLKKLFESVTFNDLKGYRYILNDNCSIPTVVLIDEQEDGVAIYEFQEYCVSNSYFYEKLSPIVQSFSLLEK